jgi:hypothetical protein
MGENGEPAFPLVKKVDFATFLSYGFCLRHSRKRPARPAKPVDTNGNQRATAFRYLLKEASLAKQTGSRRFRLSKKWNSPLFELRVLFAAQPQTPRPTGKAG